MLRSAIVRDREALYEDVDHALVDQQLCLDLLRHYDFCYVTEIVTATRLHDESITASVEAKNPRFAGKLSLLQTFGRDFLTDAEYRRVERYWLNRYYSFLARQAIRGRGPGFWMYHRRLLRGLGRKMRISRIVRRAAYNVLRRRGSSLTSQKNASASGRV